MISNEKAQEIASRVKEKLDFNLQMEKEGWLYNWSGNEVVWLLEYLWGGGRFNNLTKDEWMITLSQERDEALEKINLIKKYNEELKKCNPSSVRLLNHMTRELDKILGVVTKGRESNGGEGWSGVETPTGPKHTRTPDKSRPSLGSVKNGK